MLRRSYILRNGIILFLLLGLYFLLLDVLGWADNTYLRLVNYVFIFAVLNNTMKHAVKNGKNYLNKFLISLITVGFGIVLSIIALFFYLHVFEPSLERYHTSVMVANSYGKLVIAHLIESLSSAFILVFIMLQFYKNKSPEDVEV